MEKKEDLRVKVKFVEKTVLITDEKTKEDKEMVEFYKSPSGKIFKPGEEALVTRRHATWLAFHKFIDPLKKESKQAKGRETK